MSERSVAELCERLLDARAERSLLGETEERRRKEMKIAKALKEALERFIKEEEEK